MSIKRFSVALLCLGLAGCQPVDSALNDNALTWLWVLLPFAGIGLAGFVTVLYRRKAQIAHWDLRVSPEEPSAKGIILWTLLVTGVIALAFTIYSLLIEIDGMQRIYNIGLWWFGTILGTTLALYLGLKMAEPRSI